MDGADLGCLTVVDHQLSHVDIAARDEQPEKAVYPSSFVSLCLYDAFPRLPPESAGVFS